MPNNQDSRRNAPRRFITMESTIYEMALARAKSKGLSFSAYLRTLACEDIGGVPPADPTNGAKKTLTPANLPSAP